MIIHFFVHDKKLQSSKLHVDGFVVNDSSCIRTAWQAACSHLFGMHGLGWPHVKSTGEADDGVDVSQRLARRKQQLLLGHWKS